MESVIWLRFCRRLLMFVSNWKVKGGKERSETMSAKKIERARQREREGERDLDQVHRLID